VTHLEIFTEARSIDSLSALTVEYTRRWNKLEDHIASLTATEAADLLAEAEAAALTDISANVVIVMIEEGRV